MKVTQAVFGVFHHFELGRELERRGLLSVLFSTFLWQRLKREGLPRNKVETFPWLHVPQFLLARYGCSNPWISDHLGYLNALAFDEWTYRRIPACDAFIAISGAGLKTGRRVQERGGKFICDRGSTHIRYRAELVRDEYLRWGVAHGWETDERSIVREEAIYEAADAITVPSTHAVESFIERGVPAAKLHMIPYGVLLDRFSKSGDPPRDRFEVLYVGSVHLAKGFQYLLQAFAQLRVPNKHLTVVGAISKDIREVLKRLPLENVSFLGTVPQVELRQWMSRSHVMAMPSLDEGMALVQGQALACGCPVIGTDKSGARDLLTEASDGFIIPVRDPDSLRDRMEQLAGDPQLQQEMSVNALAKVSTLGGWKVYGDRWEQLLRDLTRTI